MTELADQIRATLAPIEGRFAVAARVLNRSGPPLLLNGHTSLHAASTMKTPVMVEVYRQAYTGRFSLDDGLRVKNTFRSIVNGRPYSLTPEDDSYETLYDHVGETRPIRTLTREMITASSNLATNILIEKVGAENVTQTMRRYGADGLRVQRGVEDKAAYRRGRNNETTAHALLVLYEQIAHRSAVSEQASEEMIEILANQEHDGVIPARLPDAVTVAHKTGWLDGLQHDAGIVFVPGGPTYVLVLLAQDLVDEDAGRAALARVSRTIFDAVAP